MLVAALTCRLRATQFIAKEVDIRLAINLWEHLKHICDRPAQEL